MLEEKTRVNQEFYIEQLYPSKRKVKWKPFQPDSRQREFIPSRPVLQEMLQQDLQAKEDGTQAHVPEMAATQVSTTALKVFKGDCWEEKQHMVWFRARVKEHAWQQ